jgi:hypothetical protein
MEEATYTFCDNGFLVPIMAKLKRSIRQIENINNDLALANDSFKITSFSEIDADGLGYKVKIKDYQGLPIEDISMQVGECAHNLRSALDNMAYALARLKIDPPIAPWQIAFPIFSDKKEFDAKWPKAKFEKFFAPEVISSIINIQPYNRQGGAEGSPKFDPLYLLSNLNNADKHRLPNLVVLAQQKIDFKGSVHYRSEQDNYNDGSPDIVISGGPLVPGLTLLKAKTKHPIVKIDGVFNIAGKVMLELEGEYYDVVSYLNDTRWYIIKVCSLFDRFFHVPAD